MGKLNERTRIKKLIAEYHLATQRERDDFRLRGLRDDKHAEHALRVSDEAAHVLARITEPHVSHQQIEIGPAPIDND